MAIAVARTPRGSLIERLEPGRYRVCDSDHHCLEVDGLWAARELVRELELHQRSIESTPFDTSGIDNERCAWIQPQPSSQKMLICG